MLQSPTSTKQSFEFVPDGSLSALTLASTKADAPPTGAATTSTGISGLFPSDSVTGVSTGPKTFVSLTAALADGVVRAKIIGDCTKAFHGASGTIGAATAQKTVERTIDACCDIIDQVRTSPEARDLSAFIKVKENQDKIVGDLMKVFDAYMAGELDASSRLRGGVITDRKKASGDVGQMARKRTYEAFKWTVRVKVAAMLPKFVDFQKEWIVFPG